TGNLAADTAVDALDAKAVRLHFTDFTLAPVSDPYDVNHDLSVDVLDVDAVMNFFTKSSSLFLITPPADTGVGAMPLEPADLTADLPPLNAKGTSNESAAPSPAVSVTSKKHLPKKKRIAKLRHKAHQKSHAPHSKLLP